MGRSKDMYVVCPFWTTHMTSDLMDQGLCMYCYGLNPWVPLDPMDDSGAYTYIPYSTVARDKRASCALRAHGLDATEVIRVDTPGATCPYHGQTTTSTGIWQSGNSWIFVLKQYKTLNRKQRPIKCGKTGTCFGPLFFRPCSKGGQNRS